MAIEWGYSDLALERRELYREAVSYIHLDVYKRQPQDTTLGRTAAPDSRRLAGEIEMEVNQDGEMGLFVPLTGLSEEQLQGRAGYLLIASLVASLTALRPDFDYVMLQVDDRLITEIPGTDLGFDDGHISRQAAIEDVYKRQALGRGDRPQRPDHRAGGRRVRGHRPAHGPADPLDQL